MIFGVLGRYFAARFAQTVLGVFAGVFALIFTLDLVETLRRSGEANAANAPLLAWLAFLHTPVVAEQALPFVVLLGSLIAFLNLSRRLELVVARAAGVSVWQFLAPAVVVGIVLGATDVTLYNPLATAMKRQSGALEAKLFGRGRATGGFWLRQRSDDGQSIIHAEGRDAQGKEFYNLEVFNFAPAGDFDQRVDAASARLLNGYWELHDATVVTPGFDASRAGTYLLATSLTAAEVAQAFVSPDSVSVWSLRQLAGQVERAGLDPTIYRLRFQQLVATPALLAAMVLVAACFSLRMFRMGGVQKMVLGGVVSGFVLYVGAKVVGDLGGAGFVSPIVAGWSPAIAGCLFGVYVLLLQEDG